MPMLDVHPSVRPEGQQAPGNPGTALCFPLVGAGRDHLTCPLRNSGGLMREMIKWAKLDRMEFNAGLTGLETIRLLAQVIGVIRPTLCSNPCLTASNRAIGRPERISAKAVSNAFSAFD